MSEKCPHCLGLKCFCILTPGDYGKKNLLYSYDGWILGKGKHTVCTLYLSGKLSLSCVELCCSAICPVCKGKDSYDWINEFFMPAYYPKKEDFIKLKEYFLKYGKVKHRLKTNFIESLKEKD